MRYWEQDSREFYDEESEHNVLNVNQVKELGEISFDDLDDIPY